MTIKHRVVDKNAPVAGDSAGLGGIGSIVSQLSGMISQVTGLANGGVGLPALNSMGGQIAALAGSVSGTPTQNNLAGQIGSLGTTMATALQSAMPALASQMSALSSQLSGLVNSPDMAKVLHETSIDKAAGIALKAFQGQHTTTWDQMGITHSSGTAVTSTAPSLPHNGKTTVSDTLQVTKSITGAAFGMLSDRRLKDSIEDHPPVLDRMLALRLKTFNIKAMDWHTHEITDAPARPSLGLIAQDVQELFPEIVQEDRFLTLEESKIGILLLGAFQEFVAESRAEIADLKRQIAESRS